MKEKYQDKPCACPKNETAKCIVGKQKGSDKARPLSEACGCERFKICQIRGDRKISARMAQLGVLPGSEIELICPVQSQNCMVKIKGSTISLDQLSAENILVIPA